MYIIIFCLPNGKIISYNNNLYYLNGLVQTSLSTKSVRTYALSGDFTSSSDVSLAFTLPAYDGCYYYIYINNNMDDNCYLSFEQNTSTQIAYFNQGNSLITMFYLNSTWYSCTNTYDANYVYTSTNNNKTNLYTYSIRYSCHVSYRICGFSFA